MTYREALKALNEAAYAASRACNRSPSWLELHGHMLKEIAGMTDRMVDDLTTPEDDLGIEHQPVGKLEKR